MSRVAVATRTYRVLLEWDPEGEAWHVSVPALPGCFTFGETQADALERAEEAIAVFLESLAQDGEPLPEDDGAEIIVARVNVPLPAPAERP